MMTAEQWYAYQDSYNKYGIDMKPRNRKKSHKIQKDKVQVTGKDKVKMILLIICTGFVCVGLIISAAYAASMKFEINKLIMANNEIKGEIENLNVKIKQNTSITSIEAKAMNQLGMAPALPSQVIYIEAQDDVSKDFAAILKEEAYN